MKKWKKGIGLLFLMFGMLTISACGNKSDSRTTKSNTVEQVLNDQVDKAEGKDEKQEVPEGEQYSDNESVEFDTTVDYDLTVMNSDMIYATVYQMMTDPNTYVGKTFRIEGKYYSGVDNNTSNRYHYCLIQDATSCCSQGVEFIWEDGSHKYPEEYPDENATIVVEGIFESYREDGVDFEYCRLKDAKMIVKK